MKKLIGLGLVAMMVMGLAGAASAADDNWAMQIRAGKLSGSTWVNSLAATTFGVRAATEFGFHASFTTVQAGIYGVNPDATKRANKDYRPYAADAQEIVWDLKLETGSAWNTDDLVTVAWWCPSSSYAPPAAPWQIQVFRNGQLVDKFVDSGAYGTSSLKVLGSYEMAAGSVEDWQIVATAVPEPGSIVAMLSGLVGLAGYGIRRRK